MDLGGGGGAAAEAARRGERRTTVDTVTVTGYWVATWYPYRWVGCRKLKYAHPSAVYTLRSSTQS